MQFSFVCHENNVIYILYIVASFAPKRYTKQEVQKEEGLAMANIKKNREGLEKRGFNLWIEKSVLQAIDEQSKIRRTSKNEIINEWLKKSAQKFIKQKQEKI